MVDETDATAAEALIDENKSDTDLGTHSGVSVESAS